MVLVMLVVVMVVVLVVMVTVVWCCSGIVGLERRIVRQARSDGGPEPGVGCRSIRRERGRLRVMERVSKPSSEMGEKDSTKEQRDKEGFRHGSGWRDEEVKKHKHVESNVPGKQ